MLKSFKGGREGNSMIQCEDEVSLPPLRSLARYNPPAYAFLKKRDVMNTRIEFVKVTILSDF
jgi:hypothetical protein